MTPYRDRPSLVVPFLMFVLFFIWVTIMVLGFTKMMERPLPPDEPMSTYQHDAAPQLGEAFACLKVEAESFPFDKMIADGHDVSYTHDRWIIDGEIVGSSDYEDGEFTACGSPQLIVTMQEYTG